MCFYQRCDLKQVIVLKKKTIWTGIKVFIFQYFTQSLLYYCCCVFSPEQIGANETLCRHEQEFIQPVIMTTVMFRVRGYVGANLFAHF